MHCASNTYVGGSGSITPYTLLNWAPNVRVAQPHVTAPLISDKSSLCPKDRRLGGPHIGSCGCAVKVFCSCSEYIPDSLLNKPKSNLNSFSNAVRLNSMQH